MRRSVKAEMKSMAKMARNRYAIIIALLNTYVEVILTIDYVCACHSESVIHITITFKIEHW